MMTISKSEAIALLDQIRSNQIKVLSLRVFDIEYLHECINFELKIGDKLCNFFGS